MCSLSSTHFLSPPRWNTNLRYSGTTYHIKVLDVRLRRCPLPSSPSRNAIIVCVASSAAGDDKGAVVKRKRGRPRKDTLVSGDAAGATEGATAPRKRGRPRKDSIAAQENKSATLVSGDAIGATEGATAPKKRGRPRKDTIAAQENISATPVSGVTIGAIEGATAPKKTERPRKDTIAAQENESASLVSGVAIGVTEGVTAPKNRGRLKEVSPQAQSDKEKKEEEKIEKEPMREMESEVNDVNGEGDEVGQNTSAGAGQDITTEAVTASSSVDEQEMRNTSSSKDNEVDSEAVTASTFIDESEIVKTPSSRKNEPADDVGDDDDRINLLLEKNDEDISFTYGWPPLICCFGAAQHAFLPSGRPANRLLNYEIHRRMRDALWAPEKFFRAPGGSAGSVAIALGNIGGKVAFMGKLGDDDYGEAMLYYLNVNNVQTRAVRIDKRRPTAISRMKIVKRGSLRISMGKPCAEDSLTKSEINIDVLKEAKMFYCNTFSLLDQNMRRTTLLAITIVKKLGGVIFYDLNLPLPLWQSSDETKEFIQEVWNLADIVEVTKQELEFLCDITPTEKFDTEDNDRSKFVHYETGVLAPLFHENLKVVFVTNGTSKIHYYTKEQNGCVRGMEDPPITPFTSDMSAAGDGIVAGLLRMLTLQPHLITDKGYIEQSIKYAISCGVTSQWLLGRQRGFPPKEGLEEEVAPDLDGIISLTEKQFRTYVKVPAMTTSEVGFPPKEGLDEEVTQDLDGNIPLTDNQFRTYAKVPATTSVD